MHGRWVKNLLKGLTEIEIKYELYEFNGVKSIRIGWNLVWLSCYFTRHPRLLHFIIAGNSKYIYNKSSICLQVILNKFIWFICNLIIIEACHRLIYKFCADLELILQRILYWNLGCATQKYYLFLNRCF